MRRILTLIPLLMISMAAGANPSGINISGKIALQADNSSLSNPNVNFRVRVLSPLGCVLYVENFPNQDLSNTNGVFNLTIGTGTAAFNAWDAVLATANSKASLLKVFSNGSTAIPSGLQTMGTEPCTGSYSPVDGDVRRIVIEFDPAGGTSYVALYPYHTIRSVPYAMLADHAMDSDKLGGVAASQYAKTSDLTSFLTAETDPNVQGFAKTAITNLQSGKCETGYHLEFNGTALTCVADSGGSSYTLPIASDTTLGGVRIKASGGLSINSSNGDLEVDPTILSSINGKVTASAIETCGFNQVPVWVSVVDAFDCQNISITASQISDFNTAVDARVSAGGFLKLDGTSTMGGDINLNGHNLVNSGYLHLATQNPGAAPAAGYVWYNNTSKQIKVSDGTDIRSIPSHVGACTDQQILKWDNGTGTWICANDVGAGGGVDAATIQGIDVETTAPTAGQFMKYVGTKWTPTSMPVCTADQVMLFNASGVATCTAISGLGDAAITSLSRSKISADAAGANHVLINDGSGNISSEAQLAVTRGGTGIAGAYTDGQLLIGKTNGTLAKSTLTPGTGINITNGDGSITISASSVGSSGITDDSIMNVDINSAAAIDRSKLANGTPNTLVVNDGTGVMVSATAITGDRALISNASGIPVASSVTNTELGYVSGVTSAIQTQLDGKLNLTGGTMSGAIAMGGNNITNTGDITMATSKVFGLSAFAADPGAPVVGQVWYNSTDKVIRYFDGAIKTLGVSGAGLQSLNGLNDNAQTFATSTAGGTFGFTSAAGVHTLNIPIADGTKDGLLSSANYTAFNSKLGAVSNTATLNDGKVWIGDGTNKAQERSISGAITIDNTGVATLATVAIAKGGTGATDAATAFKNLSPLAAKGDLVTHDGTNPAVLNVGADGKALVADSSAPNGIKWGDVFATDLVNISGLGIVQKTAAGTYVTLGVTSPLNINGTNIEVGAELTGLSGLAADGYVKRTGAGAYGVTSGASAATASTVVERDASGNSAFNGVKYTVGSGTMTETMAAGGSTTFSITWPNALPAAGGKVLSSDASGNLSWIDVLTGSVTSAQITDGTIVDADISATAAISRSKLADGTNANRLLINDGTKKMAEAAAITPSMALISDANGIPTHSAVTAAELGRLSGVTSDVQTQLDGKLNLTGGTMSGAIAMGGNNITNTGDITMAGAKVFGLSAFAADPGAPVVGQVWYNSTDKVIRYFDGAIKTLGVSGAGLQSLNGLNDNAQTFATSTAGGTFGFTSAAGVHTLNIPIADGTKDGLLSSANYTAFNSKLGAVSNTATLNDGNVWIGDATNKAQERSISGAITIDNTGIATLATVAINKGGTGATDAGTAFKNLSPMTTKGDLIVHDGTAPTRLPVSATQGQALVVDNTAPNGVKWGDVYATDLVNITGLGIVQKTAAGTYTTLNVTSPLAIVGSNIQVGAELTGLSGLSSNGYVKRTGAGTYGVTAGDTAATASTVVERDVSGISAFNGVTLKNGSGTLTQSLAAGGSSNLNLTWPNAAPGGNGYVLSTTTAGVMSWIPAPSGADNLGNHTATQNLKLGSYYLSSDGGDEGIRVGADGTVQITTPGANSNLFVGPADDADAQGNIFLVGKTSSSQFYSRITGGRSGEIVMETGDVGSGYQFFLDSATKPSVEIQGTTGKLVVGSTTTANSAEIVGGAIRLTPAGSTANAVGFKAPALSASTIWTLPAADGTNGQVLQTNGAGVLSWVGQTAAPGAAGYSPGNQGLVSFDTNAAVSGITVTSGVASVDSTQAAAASKILKLDASSKAMVKGIDFKDTTNSVTVVPASGTAAYTLTLPATQGGANTVLSNNGSGVLSWVSPLSSLGSGTADQVLRAPAGGGAAAFGSIDLSKSGAVGTSILGLANGGTGALNAAGARTNLGLGTAATVNTGSAAGNIPLLGVGGLVANKMCVSDGTGSGIICTSNIPTTVSVLDDLGDVYNNNTNRSLFIGTGTPQTGSAATNLAVGHSAMSANTTGNQNVALGTDSMLTNTTGGQNVSVGSSAMYSNTDGFSNVAIGTEALWANLSGQGNTAVGYNSLMSAKGSSNTGIGQFALVNVTTGGNNVGLGDCAGCNITTGSDNIAIGNVAGRYTSTGSSNVYIGAAAGSGALAVRNNNVIIGHNASNAMTTGSDNVVLGYNNAQALTTGTRNIVIGSNINMASGTATNTLNIGNLIFGTGVDGTGTTLSAGKIGIGVTAPATKLEVNGGIRIGTEASACAAGLAGALRYNSPNVEFCNGTSWTAFGTGSGSGTVTTISSANGDITVSNPTTTPQLTLNSGTTGGAGDANKIAKLDASGLIATAMLPSVTVAKGGTGLTGGTSGGIPYFNSATTMASSGVLASNGVVLGGGAGASPTTTAAGAAYQVLRVPSGGGAPAFGAIDISQSAAVTGVLPIANGGTGGNSLPAANNILMSNGTGIISAGSCTVGQTLYYTGSTWACSTDFVAANVASAVNYLILNGSTGTNTVKLTAGGTATNLDITINGKGTGSIVLGDSAGSATSVRTDKTLNVNATYIERAPASATGSVTVPVTSNIYRHALTSGATSTLTLPACPASGAAAFSLTIKVTQANPGTGVLAWAVTGTTLDWDSATEPTMTTTASKDSIYQFICIGDENKWYGMQVWKYQ